MAELAGLRPARELLTDMWDQEGLITGAYAIYAQDEFSRAAGNTTYYMAKWISLDAGDYILTGVADDSATFALDGNIKAEFILTAPTPVSFHIATGAVFRLDVTITNAPPQTPAFFRYKLTKADGTLVEFSRADGFIANVIPVPTNALGPRPVYGADERFNYPVFLPRPNWANGLSAVMEWKTDILMSETAAEQRRRLRISPRRAYEAGFMRVGPWQMILDAFLVAAGQHPVLLPLWADETALDQIVAAGEQILYGDFRTRDFEVGKLLILRRDPVSQDPFDYELALVSDVSDYTISLAAPVAVDCKIGTTVTPIRVAQVRDEISLTQMSDMVTTAQIRFWQTELFNREPDWSDQPTYGKTGLHIWTLEPDIVTSPTITIARNAYPNDIGTGVVYTVDPGNQAATSTKAVFHIPGRQEIKDFEKLMMAIAGKSSTFHFPTWRSDLELVRNIVPSEGAIAVKRCGVSQYLGANQKIRTDILIQLYDGTLIPNTIISAHAVADTEWLFLSETTPAVDLNDVRRISYMPVSRLDVDTIELMHLTDAVATVSLTIRALDDRRQVGA